MLVSFPLGEVRLGKVNEMCSVDVQCYVFKLNSIL
jgi:hypothetical protein